MIQRPVVVTVDCPLTLPVGNVVATARQHHLIANTTPGLFEPDPTGRIRPVLAESWSSQDGRHFHVTLRDSNFVSGTPIRPSHVAESIERWNHRTKTWTDLNIDVCANGVVLTVQDPDLSLIASLADPGAAIVHQQADGTEEGAGPFQIEELTHDQAVLAYVGSNRNAPSTVVFRYLRTVEEMYDDLIGGSCDVLFEAPYQQIDLLLVDPRFRSSTAVGFGANGIHLNCRRFPFNDIHRRRALAHALDREDLLGRLNLGTGVVANGPLSPASAAFDPAFRPFQGNKRAAMKELAASGGPFSFELLVPGDSDSFQKWATIVTSHFGQIGVTTNAKFCEFNNMVQRLDRGDFDAAMLGIGGAADPHGCLAPYFETGGAKNDTGYSDLAVDRLISGARRCSGAGRMNLYRQAQELIVNDAPMMFTRHGLAFVVTSPRVHGVVAHPDGVVRLRHAETTD